MALSPEDQRLVQDHVSVVFHLAASLDWRASLKKATAENVGGTKMVLDFCQGIKNLVVSRCQDYAQLEKCYVTVCVGGHFSFLPLKKRFIYDHIWAYMIR